MPTRNVNLNAELDRFVLTKVESGRYENASEVVRAALRTLEREEQEYEAKLAGLLSPVCGDTKLQQQKRSQLDRLHQRVSDDLDKLIEAIGL